MMVVQITPVTVEEFEAFAALPENRQRNFELIGGKIVEVVSNPLSSKIAGRFATFIGMYLLEHDIGHMTVSDGGYEVSGERYIPDVAFIRYEKQPELDYHEDYNPNPPDLAIEVLSPSNTDDELAVKIVNYLAAGTVVWTAKPPDRQVKVFAPGKPVQVLGMDDVLDGGDVLPGFKLPVRNLFPAE